MEKEEVSAREHTPSCESVSQTIGQHAFTDLIGDCRCWCHDDERPVTKAMLDETERRILQAIEELLHPTESA